jgi:hypothetical protein
LESHVKSMKLLLIVFLFLAAFVEQRNGRHLEFLRTAGKNTRSRPR